MKTLGQVHTVTLQGTPRRRGQEHGEELRAVIHQGIGQWKERLHEATGLDPDAYLQRFVQETNFTPAIQRWAPELLEEIRGLGEGAGLPWHVVYAYQLADEEWHFRATVRRSAGGGDHCSALAVFDPAQERPILAQNMDLPTYYDGTQTLLRIRHDRSDVESLVLTAAGFIATNGLNNHGVGICCNTLAQLAHSSTGLPVAFIVRTVLEQPTRRDATSFVRSVHHASGQNYTIGGPDGAVSLECSAHSVHEFHALPTRVYHTNHPLANPDLSPEARTNRAAGNEAEVPAEPALSNSEIRLEVLEQALEAADREVTVDDVRSILSAPPVAVARSSASRAMTFGSVIMELSTPPILHLAAGPPSETDYGTWTFS